MTSPLGWRRWLLPAVGVAIVGLGIWITSSHKTAGSESPNEFSSARAIPIVEHLCNAIGMRPNGSSAHRAAAEYLADQLRTIPRVAVELQSVGGTKRYQGDVPWPPFVYQTTNVIARLPGRRSSALLLDAHFDTLVDSVGAGDDALGVAVMVETLRVLAEGPQLEHSVVVNLNGAEEVGMLGAAGFLQHPLANDVRAYLYVDGGPRGKPVVIGAGPGNGWLLKDYADAAGGAFASVVGEDLVNAGVLPHNGDFLPFHEAGLVGADIAAVADFWSVHTDRDRADRVEPQTIQRMGEGLVAASRRLASGPLPGNVDGNRYVYYDFFGKMVAVYRLSTARILALVVLAMAMAVLVLALRRRVFTAWQLLRATGRLALALLSSVVAATLVAALAGQVLKRPHGWFASPWLAVFAFSAPALSVAAFALSWRRPVSASAVVPWGAALVWWSLLLALATWAGLGAGYLPLWWTAGLAAGLAGMLALPHWRGLWWLLSFVPAAALALGFAVIVIPFLVADVGLVPFVLDVVIAALVALVVVTLAPALWAAVPSVGSAKRWLIGSVFVTGASVACLAASHPYSLDRPKRISAAVVHRGGATDLRIASHDGLSLVAALANVPGAKQLPDRWTPVPGLAPPFSFGLPAATTEFAAPRIEILSSTVARDRANRTVQVRLISDGLKLRLYLPRSRLRAWSLGEIPNRSLDPERVLVVFEGATLDQRTVTLELAGDDPIEVELVEMRGPSTAPEVQALRRQLPGWVALDTGELWSVKQSL